MASLFKSFTNAASEPSEAEIVALAEQLLNEHGASREAATKAHNMVCGHCRGEKIAPSRITNQVETCFACHGTGEPNDIVKALPALSHEDTERLWKIGRLLQGPHGKAVLHLIREQFPAMYAASETGAPN